MPNRKDRSRLKQGLRNTEIKRETDVRGSLGKATPGTDAGRVTPDTDLFKKQEDPKPPSR